MKLDKQLFDSVAKLAAESPRLLMNYDLRDSEEEDGQRMLNVLLPGTKSAIHRHTDTSEVVVCIYGSAIERFYDDEGNVEFKNSVDLGLTIDERIADGYYYSKSVRLLKYILEHPECLEKPFSEPVDY